MHDGITPLNGMNDMNRSNLQQLKQPIINRVIELNRYLIRIGSLAYKIISRNYIDNLLKQGHILFNYAMRQLKGLDYYKRACEIVYEIQSGIYFIAALGGCKAKQASVVDVMCDEILSMLSKMSNKANAGIKQS